MNRLWLAAALLALAGCAKSYEPVVEPEASTKADDPWVIKDLSSQMRKGAAESHAILADFGATRSTVVVNEAETAATPVWSANDTFEMYGYDAEDRYMPLRRQ